MTRKSTSGRSSARRASNSTGTKPGILYRIGDGERSVEEVDLPPGSVARQQQLLRRVEVLRPSPLGLVRLAGAQQGHEPLVRLRSLTRASAAGRGQPGVLGARRCEVRSMTVDD